MQRKLHFTFCAVLFTLLTNVSSFLFAAKLEKMEKVFTLKSGSILLISMQIDAGEIYVHNNREPDQVYVSVKYNKETDDIDIEFDKNKDDSIIVKTMNRLHIR